MRTRASDVRTRASDVSALATVQAMSRACGSGIFLGTTPGGPAFAPPEHCVLVLGPPRSGKTTSLVVPNILAANAAVLSTSTKPDVLNATAPARRRAGRCLLFDPGGSVEPPRGVELAGWTPLDSSRSFDGALLLARAMTGAARPGADQGESAHWTERAGILVACLLHAAALEGEPITTVLSAVNRHDPGRALAVLDEHGADGPFDNLSGIVATDAREQSGIWSTASGVLSAYQSRAAVESALLPPIDPRRVVENGDTVYVVAGSDRQRQAAALVAGLVHDLRRAAYGTSQRLTP
ncbi:MAG TPA: type IV secretory system conjugative DNA transfer family protein, partial [Acidimicrobiales bacterium]|nr:type IV secretory system conjugative DNA transfer family protein [Acidimicrobiales bacterium]